MNTPPDFTTYTRDYWTCLLDIERRAVDNDGMFGRTTELELEAIGAFERDEIIKPWRGRHSPIKLTDRGWAVAHAIGRACAEKIDRGQWPRVAVLAHDAVVFGERLAAGFPRATFDEVWAIKEAEGYQYGPDALEGVRFGWTLHDEMMAGKYRGHVPTSEVS